MPYIYLLCAICTSALLSIMSSLFGRKNPDAENSSLLYSIFVTGAAFITWGIFSISNGDFIVEVMGYSALFGVFYTIAMLGMFKAYQEGSVSLTAFVKQLSLIGVAVWGLIFWGNKLAPNIIAGLILIVAALFLCFKPQKNSSEKNLSVKWCIYALMLLAGNAGCSIIQKYQQMEFSGNHKIPFMFLGALTAFVFSLAIYLKNQSCKLRDIQKKTVIFPIIGGVSSALLNLFILLLISSPLSESIIFPGIAVGGLILTMLFSVIVYREKLRIVQWFGLCIGTVALVFLNI